MGIETTILELEPSLDLRNLTKVKVAVEDGLDWYLGSEPSLKADKHKELLGKAKTLTRDDVLEATKKKPYAFDEKAVESLTKIPEDEFNRCLKMVVDSAGPFDSRNSHLFFDWDKLLPGELAFSCGSSLLDILSECMLDEEQNGIVKLDPWKLRCLAGRLVDHSFKFSLAKWIGYFFPSVGERMVDGFCRELGCGPLDVFELIRLKNLLGAVVDVMDPAKTLWMMISY